MSLRAAGIAAPVAAVCCVLAVVVGRGLTYLLFSSFVELLMMMVACDCDKF